MEAAFSQVFSALPQLATIPFPDYNKLCGIVRVGNLWGGEEMRSKWIKRGAIFLLVFVFFTGAFLAARQLWFNPYRGTITAFRQSEKLETVLASPLALEDLDFLARRLQERHPACIDGLPENVQALYEWERSRIISSPGVSVLSLWQSSARLLALLHDAHTTVGVKYENGGRVGLSFAWEKEGLICKGGEYNGFTVVEIGGKSVPDLFNNYLSQFSYELETWARHSFTARLNQGEYLAFIGVDTENSIPFLLKNPQGGALLTAVFNLRDGVPEVGNEGPSFSYSVDPAAGVGIFSLRQCIYDENYRGGLGRFFASIRENNCSNVIIDLRGNPGGNSRVADEFIRYLPAEDYSVITAQVREGPILWKNKPQRRVNRHLEPIFTGKVYVLTSMDTFSAAMDFAVLISDNNLGTIIGEIPGNMPSSYGDILHFQTPNAGLAFTISHKYFVRPDATKSGLPLVPDIIVPAEEALSETVRLIGQAE